MIRRTWSKEGCRSITTEHEDYGRDGFLHESEIVHRVGVTRMVLYYTDGSEAEYVGFYHDEGCDRKHPIDAPCNPEIPMTGEDHELEDLGYGGDPCSNEPE